MTLMTYICSCIVIGLEKLFLYLNFIVVGNIRKVQNSKAQMGTPSRARLFLPFLCSSQSGLSGAIKVTSFIQWYSTGVLCGSPLWILLCFKDEGEGWKAF